MDGPGQDRADEASGSASVPERRASAQLLPVIAGSRRRILIVDDSRAQRLTIAALLRTSDYELLEAATGPEALAICRTTPPDLVLSDWVMPGMSGPELCRAYRDLAAESYGYFILLTSKNERAEIAHGLDEGADDFLTKPVDGVELRARIKAGLRLVDMQRELGAKNRMLADALGEVQRLYGIIDSELMEARKLQQSLVRDRHADFGTCEMSLLLRSSGHVGGDLVGHFRAGASTLGLFAIDVSGHGISSALMTARLAGLLSTPAPQYNVALAETAGGYYRMLPTNEVVRRLNDMMHAMVGVGHYFTMALAAIDIRDGSVRMTQAGHPFPMVQRASGAIEQIGAGGLPVGLIDNAVWEEIRFRLKPGDRLLLCSDGITECPDAEGRTIMGEEGLAALLRRNRMVSGPSLLEAIVWELTSFRGDDSFPDDVSAALLEFRG